MIFSNDNSCRRKLKGYNIFILAPFFFLMNYNNIATAAVVGGSFNNNNIKKIEYQQQQSSLSLLKEKTTSQRQRQNLLKEQEHYDTASYLESSSSSLLNFRGGSSTALAASTVSVDNFLNAVDIFGTAVFAFSGALTAGKKGMDLLGMFIIATITAVGGGTVRDLVLDSGTVFWMEQTLYVQITAVTTLLTFYVWPTLESKLGWKDTAVLICTADALGLGAFSVLGTQKAINVLGRDKAHPLAWVLSGLVSSCFGGIIRDMMILQKPRVLYPERTLYATPPLLGSIVYTVLTIFFTSTKNTTNQLRNTQIIASIAFLVTFVSRVICFNTSLRLPHWDIKSTTKTDNNNGEDDKPSPRID